VATGQTQHTTLTIVSQATRRAVTHPVHPQLRDECTPVMRDQDKLLGAGHWKQWERVAENSKTEQALPSKSLTGHMRGPQGAHGTQAEPRKRGGEAQNNNMNLELWLGKGVAYRAC
jgi:hypothetical protein